MKCIFVKKIVLSLKKTKGIVLNQFKYSETSLIVNILTKDYGKMSFIVNGVRKRKPKFPANYFQAFNILDIVYSESKKSDLHRITELSNSSSLNSIIFDIHKSSICLFLAEIINITNQSSEKDEALYNFLEKLIIYIDSSESANISNIHLWSILRIMQFNGINPNNNHTVINKYFNPIEGQFTDSKNKNALIYSEKDSEIIHQLLQSQIEESSNIRISRENKTVLLNSMIQYFQIHIDGFRKSKSLDILSEVFE
jgi:DNA repair protein RecO (recombination protein O)